MSDNRRLAKNAILLALNSRVSLRNEEFADIAACLVLLALGDERSITQTLPEPQKTM